MNVNSVDNSLNWSGTGKTEIKFSKASSFASKLNAAKKSNGPVNQNSSSASALKITGFSDNDYKQLALKFNPRNMTLEDYNSFFGHSSKQRRFIG